ncbi:hypothetical protein D3C76_960050 [compost metagenome]
MHAHPQAQTESGVVLAVQRIGEHPQLLGVGDEFFRCLQVRLGDAAAFQQAAARNAGMAEHFGCQYHRVQGGQGAFFGKLGWGHLNFSCRNATDFSCAASESNL